MNRNLFTDYEKTKENALACLEAGVVPFVSGSPSAGKSSMFAEIAKENDLKLIDLRMGQLEAPDLN